MHCSSFDVPDATIATHRFAKFLLRDWHMLEVRDLELVEAITAHGSFARAARVLGVSQSALTRHVAALEQRLRGVLFGRRNQGIEQTDRRSTEPFPGFKCSDGSCPGRA